LTRKIHFAIFTLNLIGADVNFSQIKQALLKTLNSFKQSLPILMGVLLLIALINTLIPKNIYAKIFTGNTFIDPFIGALMGSVFTGNPITSYIIGGELLKQGVSLFAVVAFILSWVTVGVVQLPMEIQILGKKFAVVRNSISFITAIIISVLAVFALRLIQ
jgi:uncharacterized membrane protein YraQ (UPF0718 family)